MSGPGAATRAAVSASALCAGYLATYFVSTALPTPLFWYAPLGRHVVWSVHPAELACDFYGRVALALAVGAACGALAWALTRGASPARLARALRLLGAWTAALLVFTAALYVYRLAGRRGSPMPLPPDYQAR